MTAIVIMKMFCFTFPDNISVSLLRLHQSALRCAALCCAVLSTAILIQEGLTGDNILMEPLMAWGDALVDRGHNLNTALCHVLSAYERSQV